MSEPRPRTTRLNGRSFAAQWGPLIFTAMCGVVATWMAYDRGAAVMEQRVDTLEQTQKRIDKDLRDARERVKVCEAFQHSHGSTP